MNSEGLVHALLVSKLSVFKEACRLEKLYTTEQKKLSEGTLRVIRTRQNNLEDLLRTMGELGLSLSLGSLMDLFFQKQHAL